jgi:hypothetical protein
MLASTHKLTFASSNLLRHGSSLRHTLCRLSNALHEVQSGVQTFNALKPKSTIPEYFNEEVQKLLDSTVALQQRVDVALQNIKLTLVLVLLDSKLTSRCFRPEL